MTNKDMYFATGSIDEKWLEEADNFVPEKQTSKSLNRFIAAAACLIIMLVSAYFMHSVNTSVSVIPSSDVSTTVSSDASTGAVTQAGYVTNAAADIAETVTDSGFAEPTNAPVDTTPAVTEAGVTEATGATVTEAGTTEATGEANEYFNIPLLPSDRTITTVGEKITDEEAGSYLETNRESIISELNASGVNTDNAYFSLKGYSHVSYTGEEGDRLTVKENFRDYLVYNGDKIIAIITVTKENGTLYNTIAYGGLWFDAYSEFLNEHKGQELVYVYAGSAELIITPDNSVYATVLSPHGTDVSEYMPDIDNPYSVFYHPSDIYIP